jgi:hypothetical protein
MGSVAIWDAQVGVDVAHDGRAALLPDLNARRAELALPGYGQVDRTDT